MLANIKAKALAMWAAAKPKLQALAAKAPLPCGIAIGYLAHGPISLAAHAAMGLIKLALHL